MGQTNFDKFPVVIYALLALFSGVSYNILSQTIYRSLSEDDKLKSALKFDLKSFLKDYEKNTFLNINEKMKGYPTTKFWIGRNFTDTFDENKKIIAPKLWFNLTCEIKKWSDIYCDNWIVIY